MVLEAKTPLRQAKKHGNKRQSLQQHHEAERSYLES